MNWKTFFTAAWVITLASAGRLGAEVPELLDDAIQKFLRDADRWAYTQTVIEKDSKGKTRSHAVVRFDPSKPYAEHYTPLSIDGRPPTPGDRDEYRRKGERLGRRAEKLERQGTTRLQKSVGELMDLDRATVASENATSVTYDVPLKKEDNRRFPPDKFRVLARIGKESRAFERIEVKLREPMRTAVVVKIKSGEGGLDFATVDPAFAPVAVLARGSGSFSILMVSKGRDYELRREEFKRVTPYAERFGVQVGTMQALDF